MVLFSDSRSSLELIKNRRSCNRLACDIRRLMDHHRGHLCLSWTRAHVGTVGNELADQLAKEATEQEDVAFSCFPMSYAVRMMRQHLTAKWNQRWRQTDSGSTTKAFFPTVASRQKWPVTPCFFSTQLLTGHGCFNSYLAWRCLQIEDRCVCGAKQTSLHLLQQCPATAALRFEFESQAGKSLRDLATSVQHPLFVTLMQSIMQLELHLE